MESRPIVDGPLSGVGPEYTAENRSLSWTMFNLTIAAIMVTALAQFSVVVAIGVGSAALVVIATRGHLVLWTPALTRRYLPARLRQWRGRQQRRISADILDPAVVLIGSGVLVDEPGANDTSVDPVFASRWSERASELLQNDGEDALASLARSIDVQPAEVSATRSAERVTVTIGAATTGSWESPAAFCLDVAALELLGERVPAWECIDVDARGMLVGALRLFVQQCPDCGGTVDLDVASLVPSPARNRTLTVDCTGCGCRLLELTVDDAVVAITSSTDPI